MSTGRKLKGHESALLRAVTDGDARTFVIFGGQGYEEYFDELTSLYETYSVLVGEYIQHMASHLLQLSASEEARKVYGKGLDVKSWILHPQDRPDSEYLSSAPVSLPCVGVVQLGLYAVTCRVLGKKPGEIRRYFSGATGHSQGIVTAVAVAASSDWPSFLTQSQIALTTLFYIGLRSQITFPVTTLPPSILADALSHGEGNPSPMLGIRDLPVNTVNKYVEKTNSHLPDDRKIAICLINGPRGVVVVGPPGSLHGLNLSLRKLKAPQGLEQGRVPHSERKLRFTNRFLPISCPFHSKYLQPISSTILSDLESLKINAEELTFPVFATDTGKNLQDLPAGTNLVPLLVEMITHLPVHWEQATTFSGATHIIDFGPGGISGLGNLTHRNKDGTGVRIIIAGALEGGGGIGGQGEIFERGEGGVRFNVDWVKQYRPRLIKVHPGRKC
jgi:fatty acid synthase subunit beta, fungi type